MKEGKREWGERRKKVELSIKMNEERILYFIPVYINYLSFIYFMTLFRDLVFNYSQISVAISNFKTLAFES